MLLSTKLVSQVERVEQGKEGCKRYHYGLFEEESTTGSSFYYIKAHFQDWDGVHIVREDFNVSVGIKEKEMAYNLFESLSEASESISPLHLPDISRDVVIAGEHSGMKPKVVV